MNEHSHAFTFDVRRTLILSRYIDAWGMPRDRVVTGQPGKPPVECYVFPPVVQSSTIHRFATVGVSAQDVLSTGMRASWEFLFVLKEPFGDASVKEVINYQFDIVAYFLSEKVTASVGVCIPESPLAPPRWRTRGIVVDEARGEPEGLGRIAVGSVDIELLWLVPIFGRERELIQQSGVEAFDGAVAKARLDVTDVSRDSSFESGGIDR